MNLNRGNTAPIACVFPSTSRMRRANRWLTRLGLLLTLLALGVHDRLHAATTTLVALSERDLHETDLSPAGAAVFPASPSPAKWS
ncbi:MAG: hypothetical protein ABSC03_00625 [Verrucomicrobiota bacterium]|jgi:hypothetical protein